MLKVPVQCTLAGQQFFFNFCELFILCSCSFHFLKLFTYAVTVSKKNPNYFVMQLQFFFPEFFLHKYFVEGYSYIADD